MRTNGTISFELETNPTYNEHGEIIAAETEYSEPIPCFITTNTDNRKGRYADGEFHMASYTILLEQRTFPTYGQVRLARRGEDLGMFRIMSVEPLETFKRTRIVV